MKKKCSRIGAIGTAGMLALSCCAALAAEVSARLEDCVGITADQQRLACYDRLAGKKDMPTESAQKETTEPAPVVATASQPEAAPSALSTHWELDANSKRGTFKFRPHHENYLIATYNHSPNEAPYRPFRALTPESKGLSHGELAYQLGFKLKFVEKAADLPVDLWFGYTQRSYWQANNKEASSPFRETDYQPEVMAVLATDMPVLGLRMRFLNLGLLHESNGQASTLSRSWNRAYLQAGFERDDFSLVARVWRRFTEGSDDDNPDIVDYMGRGDLLGTYRRNGHEFSLLTRYNFRTDKGALQLGWEIPVTSHLRGYLQLFSGYGYTLIDYNHFQRVIGAGFMVKF